MNSPLLNTHAGFVAEGGYYREEAIMLLRRFYMSENPTGEFRNSHLQALLLLYLTVRSRAMQMIYIDVCRAALTIQLQIPRKRQHGCSRRTFPLLLIIVPAHPHPQTRQLPVGRALSRQYDRYQEVVSKKGLWLRSGLAALCACGRRQIPVVSDLSR